MRPHAWSAHHRGVQRSQGQERQKRVQSVVSPTTTRSDLTQQCEHVPRRDDRGRRRDHDGRAGKNRT